MGGLRRWVRRLERDAAGEGDTVELIDEDTGESYIVPKGAVLQILGHIGSELGHYPEGRTFELPPSIEAIMPTEDDPHRLERLYHADNGTPFWFPPTARRRREEEAAYEG